MGVLHGGNLLHTEHHGLRDYESPSSPNDRSIYRIASLSKVITVGVVASFVDEGILQWDTPIHTYLPEFGERKDEVGQKTTLIDLLSNRTGLALANAIWGQMNGVFLLPKEDIIRTSCFVPAVRRSANLSSMETGTTHSSQRFWSVSQDEVLKTSLKKGSWVL